MAAGLAVALVVAEVVLRLFRLAPTQGVETVTASEFERLPGIFGPNQHVRALEKPDLPYTVTIDSLGFRGADFPRAKPPGQLRVLMIGDSYVYGDFVDDSVTLPTQLDKRLRAACPDALVINAGLGWTTIPDQTAMLKRALPLDPDLVILVFVNGIGNDIEELGGAQTNWDRMAENRQSKSRFPLSIFYPLLRRTALWNLALKARAGMQTQRDVASLKQADSRDSAGTIGRLRGRYGAALVAFHDTLAARGIPLIYVMFPSWSELNTDSENLTWLERFADSHSIHWVSLLAALQASHLPATALSHLPKDTHPSPTGYSIAADELAATILHGPPPPPSCHQ
jgi:hypothetical protein